MELFLISNVKISNIKFDDVWRFKKIILFKKSSEFFLSEHQNINIYNNN